nr:hypothetical protein [Chitinophagaceae bacterium]
FTNLTDGTLATGTNTPTLNLIGANPSFTGYRFRCLVNSVPQAPVTLRYYTYFTGTLGNAWNNAANWSCGVPTIQMDAVFTGSVNLIGSANEVRKAHVRPGASVTLAPGATLLIAE